MKKLITISIMIILIPVFINGFKYTHSENFHGMPSVIRQDAVPVIADIENPFYAIIATPVTV